jgi:hypothetical protein
LLEVAGCGGEIEMVEGEGQVAAGGQGADELGVAAGGVAAQVVVDVDDAEGEIPAGSEVAEDVEEAHGIGAAGDGDGDAVAGREHAMALNGMDDAVEQDDFIVGPDGRRPGMLDIGHA